MIDLSIIVLNWNTKKLLKNCLISVFKQTKNLNFEVIVVDNGSTDDSVKMIKKEFLRSSVASGEGGNQVVLIENKKNLGFAAGNNQGIKKANGEYLLLLNSDTKISNNAFKQLLDFARSKDKLAVVGPQLINPGGKIQRSSAPFYTLPVVTLSLFCADYWLRRAPTKAKPVDWVEGSCFLISRAALDKIGLLDEKFFMYVEEMEFCYRAKKAGFSVWFYPGAQVYHLVRGSSQPSFAEASEGCSKQKAIWWIYEGLIYFYQKHFAPWQLVVLKFLLRTKAVGAWLLGVLTGNKYLKETYAKAFKMVYHV